MKKIILVLLISSVGIVYGDESGANELSEALVRGEESVLKEESKDYSFSETDLSSVIKDLNREVQSLKVKSVLSNQLEKATQSPEDRKKVGGKTYFNFKEGALYEVYAGVDMVTDIELSKGEVLTSAPLSGDTVRWKISVAQSGVGENEITHLIIKPLEEGLLTNLILTTNKRVYHIKLISGDWHMSAVSWNYPDEEYQNNLLEQKRLEEKEVLFKNPEELNFKYEISGDSYKWKPIRVFDDGTKCYVQMPENLSSSEAPVFFIIDEGEEPELVNYRVRGSYYVVDRIFERAELRVGQNKRVEIISDSYEKSFWERIF